MSVSEPFTHDHDGEEEEDVICPSCGEQGFDGLGPRDGGNCRMYLLKCWNCGLKFAVQDPHPQADDE
jgi:rRNA maturation protein Nop10